MKQLHSLGYFVHNHNKTIIALWLVSAVILSFFAVKVPSVLSGNGFTMDKEAEQVETILSETFEQPQSAYLILFTSDNLHPSDTVFQEFVEHTISKVKDTIFASAVISPYDDADMQTTHAAYAIFAVDHHDISADDVELIREVLANINQNYQDLSATLTGEPVIEEDINHASQQDLIRAEMIGIPAALIILLLAFGGIVLACIPIIVGILTVVSAMGILYLLAAPFEFSIFLLNVVPMIGLALSIDFALLVVSRFREELAYRPVDEAVAIALSTAGHSILISGLCVFLGMSALLLYQINVFLTVGIGGMTVIALAVLSAITLLPAILSLLGHKIHVGRLFKQKKQHRYHSYLWYTLSKYVLKIPMITSLVAISILAVCLLPIKDIRLQIPEFTTLPSSYESRQALVDLEEAFGKSQLYPIPMIIDAPCEFDDLPLLEQLKDLIDALEEDVYVTKVKSLYSYLGNPSPQQLQLMFSSPEAVSARPVLDKLIKDNKTVLEVYLSVPPSKKAARDWVDKWEKTIADSDYNFSVLIGGKVKFEQEIYSEINKKTPYVFAFIVGSVFIILLLAFQSLLIPIKAILLNALGLGATFGILVWIFQFGHLSQILFFEPEPIGIIIPIFIFSIIFCLSIDYEIFLVSRIYEIYKKSGNHTKAILLGLTSTSQLITSAASIMIVITGAFAFTGVVVVKQMGIGIALAIFIDVTLIRILLVPAIMLMLGKACWWLPFKRPSY